MDPLDGVLCTLCGEKLPERYFADEAGPRCVPCQHAAPLFRKAVAYGAYDGALRDLLHLFKYQHVRSAAPLLGRLLNRGLAGTELPESLLVVPVPLFRAKQRSRGFNQAEDIARNFVRCRAGGSIQVETAALIRTRETASQTGLTRDQRRSNLRGAFAVPQPEKIRGRNILIVDDVMTTGTTAGECTRVLLRAGADQIFVATVARAIKGIEGMLANAASGHSASLSTGDHSRGTLGHA
jgi:ComF family protein